MAAQVGTIDRKLGGTVHAFGLLSMEDIVTLTNQTPSNNGEIIDINALNKWTQHPIGSVKTLLLSAQKVNPKTTYEEVATWGSVLGRAKVANEIFLSSIVNGEEPESAPKAEGGQGTGGETPPK